MRHSALHHCKKLFIQCIVLKRKWSSHLSSYRWYRNTFHTPARVITDFSEGCLITNIEEEQDGLSDELPAFTNADIRHFSQYQSTRIYAKFVVTIPRGRVFGGKNYFICNRDNTLIWALSPTMYCFDKHLHHAFSHLRVRPLRKLKKVIFIGGNAPCGSYYHWCLDVFARFFLLQKIGIHLPDYQIVIDYAGMPYEKELLASLGISCEQVIANHPSFACETEELVIPAFTNPTLSPEVWSYDREAVNFLRKLMVPQVSSAPKRKLYVSRRDSKRSISNENELIAFLKKEGFEVVTLSNLTVRDQARLFYESEIIIAPHGAGLTNIIYTHPDTRVVEILSGGFFYLYFWRLAASMKRKYYAYVEGEIKQGVPLRRLTAKMSFRLNVKKFCSFLKENGLTDSDFHEQ